MTSPFANLFLKLVEKITTDVPAIRFTDQDWNQLDYDPPPLSYPALLIDFADTSFTQMQGYQDGNCSLILKIIYRSFTSTSSLTPQAAQQQALEFYEIEQAIYEALQAWYADGLLVNPFIRQRASTDKRNDGLRVRIIEFNSTFSDMSVTA